MGALTLKSLTFYLRNWDTEKSESFDPTDGFGSNTRVYIHNNQILLIEPEFDIQTFNTWLTDRGRQFFDGLNWIKSNSNKNFLNSWHNISKQITQILYLYDHCNYQSYKKHFFTIIFENISLEVLSLLIIISQNYSFINIKRADSFNLNNDLESNYQLYLTTNNKTKLSNSSLCILLSTNPRYEGYLLNLSLRQRFVKGNFKCFSIGSLINLTFPVSFLGSNLNCIKSIAEGKHLICQSLKLAKNPLIIYNNEIFKRVDRNSIIKTLQILFYLNIFNKSWNNINCFSSSLSETGNQSLQSFSSITKNDLVNSSILYLLNINTNSISNLKVIANYKILNLENKILNINKLFLDQSSFDYKNLSYFKNNFNNQKVNYFFFKSSFFYENEESFINTEGLIKRTTKLIFKKNSKSHWQLLRKIFKLFKNTIVFLNNKNNDLIFFNLKNKNRFQNFVYFHFQATKSLTNISFYLSTKTNSFNIFKNKFKIRQNKLFSTNFKYWLDDFYSGSKDEYSQNSLTMSNCSKILRFQTTNFF